ncbi:unnamed protein product [Adineta steineri]|uniref:DYW domain-containing protein n=1 Tax=Adineta steineri TaxID=433720 RepID=A0A814KKS6_9BILA|nr:unnamed protein product [Adineta steineri]CAF1326722.1 unnamed protein product [Adineta steineri]
MKRLNDNQQYRETIILYKDQIKKQKKQSTSLIINQVLKACIELDDIKCGKDIHKNLSSYMLNNQFIENNLIRLYMKCGDYEKSKQIFLNSKNKTTPMFNNILNGLVDNNQCNEALNLFKDNNIPTNEYTFSILFKICSQINDRYSLQFGKEAFNQMPKNYYNSIVAITSALHMFTKCGDISKAEQLFNQIKKKNLIVYGAMMNGYLENNMEQRAVDLFFQIEKPNEIILNIFFNACAQLKTKNALNLAKNVFDQSIIKSNDLLLCSVLNMFIKCDDLENAQILFNRIDRDIIAYGSMMKFYNIKNQPLKTLELYQKLKDENFKPDKIILNLFFNACAQLKTKNALNLAKNVFDQFVIKSNDLLYSILNMFIKCDDLENAEILFDRIDRDIIAYGSMMKFYNIKNQPLKTLELYQKLKEENLKPTEITFVLLIDACSEIGDLSLSESLVCQIPESFLSNLYIRNALIDLFGKVGLPSKSKEIFDMIEHPDNVSFAAMINAYGLNGMGIEAIKIFHNIPSNMLNNAIYVCVLNACSHSALVNQAQEIFQNIPSDQRTEQIYTTMVDSFSRVFLFDQAQKLIDEYEKYHSPSAPMYMSILSSARNAKNILLAEKIFHRIELNFANNESYLMSAQVLLANTYALIGEKFMSSYIRMKIKPSNTKNTVGCSWTVVDGKVYKFRAHDRSHSRSSEIYEELDRLTKNLIEHGYKYDESWITRELDENETTQSVLCGHSERLAIAFNLIQQPIPDRIQIVKNLRVCGDCHLVIKLIAQIYQRLIVVRDVNRIHHFYPNGKCSCQDRF